MSNKDLLELKLMEYLQWALTYMELFNDDEKNFAALFWDRLLSKDAQHYGDSSEAAVGPLLFHLLVWTCILTNMSNSWFLLSS